jgi:hypothetical protein
VSSQIELLTKRLDENDKNSKAFKKSSSTKSFSTSNTLFDESEDGIKHVTEFKISEPAEQEWRKEIEKSIERISEKVASNNSNILVSVLEKRVNEINNDNAKLKKSFAEYLENSNLSKKNFEKFEKSEKVLQELILQVSAVKNSNYQYQTDILKNINEVNEKLISQQLMWEQFENFETKTNNFIEIFNSEVNKMNVTLRSLNESRNNLNDRLTTYEEKSLPEIIKSCGKLKDDIVKIEGKLILIF